MRKFVKSKQEWIKVERLVYNFFFWEISLLEITGDTLFTLKYPPLLVKEDLTSEGFDKILSIKANMNEKDYKIKVVRRVRLLADKSIIRIWINLDMLTTWSDSQDT